MKSFFRSLSPSAIFIAGFFIIIVSGAVLLSLPVSSASGDVTPFFNSLFTAVSSTCITGLVVYDTFTHWSFFGQAVLLFLIQVGGLGFMTVAASFALIFRKNVGHKERMMLVQTFNLNDMSGVVKLFKHIVVGTFSFEGAAAVILAFRFIPDYGIAGGIWRGVFISVSAFCNAGFDLMGTPDSLFPSLTAYADDLVVNLTVCSLVVIGGLGFLVWDEIFSGKGFKKMSVQSKIVIIFSFSLIVIGTAAIFLFEFNNPETLGPLSAKGKFLASLFQSVSPRTAGFNPVVLSSLTEESMIVFILLMFIGGSSGSTAGGVKTNTVAVLFFATVSVLCGRKEAVVMKRRIAQDTVLRAFALVFLSITILLFCSFAVSVIEDVSFIAALFECTSAFCTVGCTLGLTPSLSAASLVILMLLMFLGRVGLLTASVVLFERQHSNSNLVSYPEAKIIIS